MVQLFDICGETTHRHDIMNILCQPLLVYKFLMLRSPCLQVFAVIFCICLFFSKVLHLYRHKLLFVLFLSGNFAVHNYPESVI